MHWQADVEEYLEHLEARHWSDTSIRDQRKILNRFFLWAWQTEGLEIESVVAVTPEVVEQYILTLFEPSPRTGKPLAIASRRLYLQAVRGFYRWLESEKRILVSPLDGLEIDWKRDRSVGTILSVEELVKLLEAPDLSKPAGLRDRAILELLYSTGLRLAELVALSIHDVDLAAELVRVNEGKGKKDRVVPLGKKAAYYLTEYIAKVRTRYTRRLRTVPTALFLAPNGGEVSHGSVRRMVTKAAKAAGMKASPHALRRSMATHLLASGAEPELVQQMLGHGDGRSLRFYARLYGPDLKAEHERTHPRETETEEDAS